MAHLLLDGLDTEVERRGHRFVRYADEGNISMKRRRAGQRGLASVTRFWERRLQWRGHETKSAVDRPERRTLLGFACTGHWSNRRRVTSWTRRVSLGRVVGDVWWAREGWYAYCGFTEAPACVKELDSWIHRRLRCSLWKQWG